MPKYNEDIVKLIDKLYNLTFILAEEISTSVDLDQFEFPKNFEFQTVDEVEASLIKASSQLNQICGKILTVYNTPDPNVIAERTIDLGEITITKEDLE